MHQPNDEEACNEMFGVDDEETLDKLCLEASQKFETIAEPEVSGTGMSEDEMLDKICLEASQKFEMITEAGTDMSEDEMMDKICLEASQQFDNLCAGMEASENSRFGKPVNNDDLENMRKSAVPLKTRQNTMWADNLWRAWVRARKQAGFLGDESKILLCDNFVDMSRESLSFWLPKFIMEVRKETGDDYPPDSVYNICCGLERNLRLNDREDVNIFVDSDFSKFRQVLDGRMKLLRSSGKFKKKQSDVITEEIEDKLWEAKILGDHSPQALVDTLFFYIGLYFALRGGDEHRKLRFEPCQIKVYEPPSGRSYLVYNEDTSKTNQGGLKNRNREPKRVVHYANTDNPSRCLLQLFKKYNSKCPPNRPAHALYLSPLKAPKGDIWYSRSPIGHNTLAKTIPRLMNNAGIVGNFTNHSLRSTSTTRLFNAHVDEQLIMMRTGHSSEKGVRAYKRASDQLLEETSDVLNKMDPDSSGKKKPQNSKQAGIVDIDVPTVTCGTAEPVVGSSSQFGFNSIVSSHITFNVFNK